MHYSTCHPDLTGLLQIVCVPKQFALAQAKKRDGAMRLCTIKSSKKKQAHFPLLGFPSNEWWNTPRITSAHRS